MSQNRAPRTEPREPSPENRRIRRVKNILEADFSSAKVIFNLENYIPYILNHTAAKIWDFLKRPKKRAEIIAFLQKRYKIDLVTAKKDTENFLKDLKNKGLVCWRQ